MYDGTAAQAADSVMLVKELGQTSTNPEVLAFHT